MEALRASGQGDPNPQTEGRSTLTTMRSDVIRGLVAIAGEHRVRVTVLRLLCDEYVPSPDELTTEVDDLGPIRGAFLLDEDERVVRVSELTPNSGDFDQFWADFRRLEHETNLTSQE